jgi:hypothetical protein
MFCCENFYLKNNFLVRKKMNEKLLSLNRGDIIDFHDIYLLKGFPLKDFNILGSGPFEITSVSRSTYTVEYGLRGSSCQATLEIEKKGDNLIILIQTALENYPSVLSKMRKAWTDDCDNFTLEGVKYYLVDDGEEEDGGEECYYWDYYSDPINDDDNKLFIGVQDYGYEDDPEIEYYIGFQIPERAIKDL